MTADSGHQLPRGRAIVSATPAVPVLRDPYAPVGGEMADDGSRNLQRLVLEAWRIVFKRRWLIASIVGLAVTIGGVRTLMMTPLYTASVRLQIDRTTMKIVEAGQVAPLEGQDFDFLKTQFELLLSRNIAERAASGLRLGQDKDFTKPREFSITGAVSSLLVNREAASRKGGAEAALEKAAAEIVLANRSIKPVVGSRLVDVLYTDPSPQRAQRVVMALAEAYIASNLDKRFEANAYAKTFLEDQLKQLKIRLEESEKVMLDFAQKEQIVATTEKASIAESNLAAANAALGALISDRIKNEQLWKQVDAASAINLPQLLTNSVIDGLRARRNALATEYQEKLETFKPEYPAMVQLKNKLGEIDRQLATEVRTIKSSYKAAFEAASTQEKEMRGRVDELKKEVLDLQQRSIQYNILKREVDSNRSLYESLLQRFKQVDIAGGAGANNVFIVDRAEVPAAPSSPQLTRSVLISLVLGFIGAFAGAFVLEHLDSRIRTVEDLERVSNLVTLGIIPAAATEKAFSKHLADPRSALSESYRSLATALQFSTDNGLPRSLFLTSAGPGEGKSTTAIALANHFARLGLKVLLIDADLRKPSTHAKMGVENDVGLSNLLTGAYDLSEAMRATTTPNLYLMTSGPIPPNPAELLGGPRLVSLLGAAEESMNFVIIDGPPVMGIADAPILANASGATLFVAGAGDARTGAVAEALRRLRQSRARLVGCVLTKFDAKSAGYGYGYGSYRGYGDYGYGATGRHVAADRAATAVTHESAEWTDNPKR